MSLIIGLRQANDRLSRFDIRSAAAKAVLEAASNLEESVTEVLSEPPDGDHSVPWLRTGALRASIGHDVEGISAVVGSISDVAIDQELGTSAIPPRSFLASTAASAANDVVGSVASMIAQILEQQ